MGPTDATLTGNTIAENAANGVLVGTVVGTDPDVGDVLTYTLTDDAGGRFVIDATTGEITVLDSGLLDFETSTSHTITVRVTDQTNLTFDKNFDIALTNVNEHPIDATLTGGTVAENAANGTVVGTVAGSDPDAGATLTYALTDDAGGRFAIDEDTGEITVADGGLLDYEAAASHSVTVRVTDQGGLTYDEIFEIALANVNEAPTDATLTGGTVAENAANGTVVGTVASTDPDAGATLTYTLTDDAGGRFAIDEDTGDITVADGGLLDYEAAASHSVTVRVTDQGGLTYDETFTISLTNVNEAPTDATLTGGTVAENAANGTVVGTVASTDPDAGATLTYALTDDAGGRFAIDEDTGDITVADGGLLDYEAAASHSVTVRITDQGGLTYDETFTISLTNVNEAPTDATLTGGTVAENAANGTVVGTVAGSDPDADATLTYALTDDAGGRFAIDEDTGEITVADGGLLDYETATSHSVTVRVTDQFGLTYDEVFEIALTNVNEHPTDAMLTGGTVAENAANGTVVGTVAGSDPDAAATLTYALTDDAGGRFAIDEDTGEITVANGGLLDYEAVASHSVTVQVTDQSGLTYDESFEIALTNVNEHPTDATLTGGTVAENAANGTVVGTMAGSDPDAGATLTYALTDDAGGRFAIDEDTGEITVANGGLLDYEAATSHSVTVRITDQGGLTYDEVFEIALTNVNEAPTNATLTGGTVAENAANGTIVGTVAGADPDAGATFTYTLTDSAGGRFAINATTGVITVADGGLLNFEAAASHSVTVRVTDQDGLTYDENFNIDLTNVNEVPTDATLTGGTVAENAANGTVVGTVAGSDPDAGATLTYALTDDAGGRFAIDATTGVITVANGGLLDYEAATSHSVTVRVTDQDGLTYDENFEVDLTNVAGLLLTGTSGDDTLTGEGEEDIIQGLAGNDLLDGAGGNDTLQGGDGDDTLIGGAGIDALDGGDGIDTASYAGSTGGVTVNLSTGAGTGNEAQGDTLVGIEDLVGSSYADLLTGDGNANNLQGGAGADTLNGGDGDDVLDGGTGNDTMAGGTGNDLYYVDSASDVVTEAAGEGTDEVRSTLLSLALAANVENLTFVGAGNATLTGNASANVITGGAGNDTLTGGAGADTLDGSVGTDTASYTTSGAGVTVNLTTGVNTGGDAAGDTLISIENITGSSFADTLTGDGNANVLTGGNGNDVLDGGTGADTLVGGTGNDIYIVDDALDVVTEAGGAGTDEVRTGLASYTLGTNVENLTFTGTGDFAGTGNSVANTITGGAGNDTLDGGTGNDTLIGGAGDDIYLVNSSDDVATELAAEGADEVRTTALNYALSANIENLTFTGVGNATLTGNADANVLTGGAGNDTLAGGAGADTLDANGGNDTASYATSGTGVTVNLATGVHTGGDAASDTLISIENITGSSFDDTLTGDGNANVLTGGAGNDVLDGGAGNDTMVGGTGDDIFYVDSASDVITEAGGEGADEVRTSLASYMLDSNVENLTFTGTVDFAGTGNADANIITGGAGNDTLDGGAGNDTLIGGTGNDIYVVDSASDVVTEAAGEGTDEVRTTALGYVLAANIENLTFVGAGNATLTGNADANVLAGGAGNDTLIGGAGADTLNGNGGNDTASYVTSASGVTVNLTTGVNTGGDATGDMLISIENLTGSSFADTLTGDGNANTLLGSAGDDTLDGAGGNDTLDGGAGTDTMAGGTGNDIYYVDSASDVVTENSGEGIDEVRATITLYTLSLNVENLTFIGAGNFTGTGNTLDNIITGGAGNDTLSGGIGNDTLNGGLGNDTLIGGVGNDIYYVDGASDVVTEAVGEGIDEVRTALASYTLAANLDNLTFIGTGSFSGTGNGDANAITGGSSDDTLSGLSGNDTLNGGDGNDTLIGGSGSDVLSGGAGTDTASYAISASGVTVNLVTGVNTGGDAAGDTLTSIENIIGSSSADVITGNGNDNVIQGGAGIDTLNGAAGNDTLDGGTGNDTMTGGVGNDIYYVDHASDVVTENASEGTDEIRTTLTSYTLGVNLENLIFIGGGNFSGTGNALNNVITGGGGDDVIDGGAGNDIMAGGAGNDFYYVESASDLVIENAGEGTSDRVRTWLSSYTLTANVELLEFTGIGPFIGTGNADNNSISGSGLNDTLYGLGGNDALYGGNGDDTLIGGEGADVLNGGSELDTASYATSVSGVTVSLTTGVATGGDAQGDTFISIENITGSAFADILTGEGNSNVLQGGAGDDVLNGAGGNDTLDGGTGSDTMIGGTGNDIFVVDSAFDIVTELAGEGTDEIRTSLLAYTLGANVENLTFIGSGSFIGSGNTANNVITGGTGNDTLDGGAGNDTLIGGAGNDIYYVDSAFDVVTEATSQGTDEIRTALTNYTLAANVEILTFTGSIGFVGIGNADNNAINGGIDDDTLSGLAGNDTLNGGDGNDILIGGVGFDTLNGGNGIDTASYATSSAAVTVNLAGSQSGGDAAGDSLSSIENLIGSTFNDTLTGDGNANYLQGGGGNDTLNGGGGNDILDGNNGTNTLVGGLGNDIYIVGAGSDTITEAAGQGIDEARTISSYTLGANVENLTSIQIGSVALTLTGNNLDNIITAGIGDDRLYGGDGNDTLNGGVGANVFDGGLGNDTITGGGGDDVIDGGAGNDIMAGGTGNDFYYVENASDLVIENAGEGTSDRVRTWLSSYTLTANVELLEFTGIGPFIGTGNADNNSISGSGLNDTLYGIGGNDALSGGNGDDTLIGGEGADVLNGGSNLDTASYVTSASGVTVNLTTGVATGGDAQGDTFISIENITGSAYADFLTGEGNSNVLQGGAGDDVLNGAGGNDTLDGGTGSDTMIGGTDDDIYYVDSTLDVVTENANQGTDEIRTVLASYTLGANVERLTYLGSSNFFGAGNAADNVIRGGTGNDTLDGGVGADTLIGGTGNDIYYIDSISDYVIEGTSAGTDEMRTALAALTLAAEVEILSFTGSGTFVGTGNNGNNTIWGGAGDDTLYGMAGNDSLIGGLGNDTLIGGVGGDVLNGGSGTDTASYATSGAGVTVNLATGSGSGNGSDALNDTLYSIENLIGSAYADTLTGDGNANYLWGGNGDDILYGGAGDDILDGGSGSDWLYGGQGNDVYIDADLSIIELAGEGIDEVRTSQNGYTLQANVENLTSTRLSTDGTNLYGLHGNELANIIVGSEGADWLAGRDGNDTLYGGGGIDRIHGDNGNDTLYGGAGDDYLDGSAGNDTAVGGVGNDVYIVDSALDIVIEEAGEGIDEVRTGLASYTLGANVENLSISNANSIGTGNALNNTLSGNSGADTLYGLDGNDTLFGSWGNDTLIGGTGADTLNGDLGIDVASYVTSASAVTVNLATGTATGGDAAGDTFISIESITGSTYADTLTGNSSDNVLDGGAGNDILTGGAGNDVYIVDSLSDVLIENFGEGTDEVRTALSAYTLAANIENLSVIGWGHFSGTGNDLDNIITSDAGNDTLDGGAGNDTLIGGAGQDIYYVDSSADVVIETASWGTDEVRSTALSYTLSANVERLVFIGSGNFTGIGNSDSNYISGGSGDDTIIGGAGGDYLSGGSGNDTVSYATSSAAVTVNLTTGANSGGDAGDSLVSFENVIGSAYADILTGDANANVLTGGAGNDTLVGNNGDDILIGGVGSDVLNGGSGADTASYATSSAAVVLNLTTNSYSGGDASGDTFNSIENLVGSSFDDILTGSSSANVLTGGNGHDALYGAGGNDTLDGSAGNDTLTGGADNDTFVFNPGFGHDTISDFTAGAASVDVIEFDDTIFADYAAVIAAASTVGANTVITVDGSNSITLQNVTLASLHQDDFRFV